MQHKFTLGHGLCACGCGEETRRAPQNYKARGIRKGDHYQWVHGHNQRYGDRDYTVDPDTGCWVWCRGRSADGYGVLQTEGRRRGAHRAFYEKRFGPVPEGLELDHLCRNRACVNPEHLEPVTGAENCRRGANAKLTAEDVQAIRASSERGVELAKRYGVSATRITQIRKFQAWRDV